MTGFGADCKMLQPEMFANKTACPLLKDPLPVLTPLITFFNTFSSVEFFF
jgi:hypothetical protein